MTEPLSRVSRYAYDSEGKVTKITDPKGGDTLLAWTDRQVTKVTEPGGAYTTYAYNQNGYATDVKELVDRKATGTTDDVLAHTRLEYEDVSVDANDVAKSISQLVRKVDPNGMATPAAENDGDYVWSFAYDAKGNLERATDPEAAATAYAYNTDGTLATVTDPRGVATTAVAGDFETRFTRYDLNGLPTKIERDYTDATTSPPTVRTQVTELGYDVDGLLRWVQDPLHAGAAGANDRHYRAVLDYDSFHRLGRQSAPKSTKDAPGVLVWTSADYDPNDNLVSSRQPDWSAGGGEETTRTFDPMDRVRLVTGPDRSQTNADGSMKLERSRFAYDAAGRLHKVTSPMGVPQGADPFSDPTPNDYTTEYVYDLLDRIVTVAEHSGDGTVLRTHRCYDLAGDLRWVTAPKAKLASAPSDCSATPPSHTTRLAYDDAHRLLTETDALGNAQSTVYDLNGDTTSRTDADGAVATVDYNERGEPVEIVEPFERDAQGNVVRKLTTKLEYDLAGNLKRVISPRAWDAAAKAQGTQEPTSFADYVTEYAYDELDRLVRVDLPRAGTEARTYVHRAYDSSGNLTMTSLPVTEAAASALAAEQKTAIAYFDTGWIKTIDDPANPKAHFDYTPEGWQHLRTPQKRNATVEALDERMKWEYYADGLVRQVSDRDGKGFTTYSYDLDGNLLKADEGRGLPEHTTEKAIDVEAAYDGFGRPTKVRHQKKGSTNWIFTKFTYDENGNVVVREDSGTETAAGTLVDAPRKHEFTYDAGDWLDTQLDHGKNSSSGATADDRLIDNTFTKNGWEQLRKILKRDAAGGFTAVVQQTSWKMVRERQARRARDEERLRCRAGEARRVLRPQRCLRERSPHRGRVPAERPQHDLLGGGLHDELRLRLAGAAGRGDDGARRRVEDDLVRTRRGRQRRSEDGAGRHGLGLRLHGDAAGSADVQEGGGGGSGAEVLVRRGRPARLHHDRRRVAHRGLQHGPRRVGVAEAVRRLRLRLPEPDRVVGVVPDGRGGCVERGQALQVHARCARPAGGADGVSRRRDERAGDGVRSSGLELAGVA